MTPELLRNVAAARRALDHSGWIGHLKTLSTRKPTFGVGTARKLVQAAYGTEGIVLSVGIAARWCHHTPRRADERAWLGSAVRKGVIGLKWAPASSLAGALSIQPHPILWERISRWHPRLPPFLFSTLHTAIARDPDAFVASIEEADCGFVGPLPSWRALVRDWQAWVEPCRCVDCGGFVALGR